jgi:PncC family amidohydrolase
MTSQAEEPEAAAPDESLELHLNRALSGEWRRSIACAESLTGGGVAHRITSIAGSSDYFQGGIVSYSNDVKQRLLGVSEWILAERGAVSAECAVAMAEGALRMFGVDFAVSTTGIAGPGGATKRKPVGLVYTALASKDGVICQEHKFHGDRAAITDAAATAALKLLIDHIDFIRSR